MNTFQGAALMVFSLLTAMTLSAGVRGMVRKRIVAVWLAIWTIGALAIVWPRSTFLVARWLGIGRGADLLLYLSVLFMLVGFFYVYGRFRRLDRQITLLVRRLAIENAEQGEPDRGPDSPGRATSWSKDAS
jgi:small membrane protein